MIGHCEHRWMAFVEFSKDDDPTPVKRWKRCLNVKCRRRVNLPLGESDMDCPVYSLVSVYDVPTIRPPAFPQT